MISIEAIEARRLPANASTRRIEAIEVIAARQLFKLFKQSSPRDSHFLRGKRKSACAEVFKLACINL